MPDMQVETDVQIEPDIQIESVIQIEPEIEIEADIEIEPSPPEPTEEEHGLRRVKSLNNLNKDTGAITIDPAGIISISNLDLASVPKATLRRVKSFADVSPACIEWDYFDDIRKTKNR